MTQIPLYALVFIYSTRSALHSSLGSPVLEGQIAPLPPSSALASRPLQLVGMAAISWMIVGLLACVTAGSDAASRMCPSWRSCRPALVAPLLRSSAAARRPAMLACRPQARTRRACPMWWRRRLRTWLVWRRSVVAPALANVMDGLCAPQQVVRVTKTGAAQGSSASLCTRPLRLRVLRIQPWWLYLQTAAMQGLGGVGEPLCH